MLRHPESITTLVIHCAATKNGSPYTAQDIDRWHQQRGFKRDQVRIGASWAIDDSYPLRHIGYHFIITVDGKIQKGRRLEENGAHVQGHNAKSIGICLIGTDQFTPNQWQSLKALVQKLQNDYGGIKSVVGHRDLSPDKNGDGQIDQDEWLKICPGFEVLTWLKNDMNPLIRHIFGADELLNKHLTSDKPVGPSAGAPAEGGADVSLLKTAATDETKPWWQSKTILGAIAAALPAIAHAAGIDYNAVVAPYAADIVTIIGAALAIIGRKVAVQAIK